MSQYFIDKFIVPAQSYESFIRQTNNNRAFIKNLHGFIGDSLYERTDENGNVIIITVAEWESAAALARAKETVQEEYKRIGFNPSEFMKNLNVIMERGSYAKLPDPKESVI